MLLAPLASRRQNPERGSGAQGTRGRRLRSCGIRRNADAAGFSCPEGGDSLPPGLSEIDLKLRKRVVALPNARPGGASGAAAAASDRKIPPVATPAPVGHPPRASQRPAPLSLNPQEEPSELCCLNRPPSLPSPFVRLVGDRKRWRFPAVRSPPAWLTWKRTWNPKESHAQGLAPTLGLSGCLEILAPRGAALETLASQSGIGFRSSQGCPKSF